MTDRMRMVPPSRGKEIACLSPLVHLHGARVAASLLLPEVGSDRVGELVASRKH